jgi:hypothetical protein
MECNCNFVSRLRVYIRSRVPSYTQGPGFNSQDQRRKKNVFITKEINNKTYNEIKHCFILLSVIFCILDAVV